MDTLSPPAPIVAPKSKHKGKRASAKLGRKRGAPCKYPWHTLEVGQTYYIPTDSDVEYDSVVHAVYRQNRINADRGLPQRFRLPDIRVPHPDADRASVKCWVLQRYA